LVVAAQPEIRRSANRQIWPLNAVLATDPATLAARMTEPAVTLLVDGATPLPQLLMALLKLADAGAQVAVRMQRADDAVMTTLRDGRAQAIEWVVRAPTTGAALAWSGSSAEADGLHDAMRRAGAHGLGVRLRWRLAGRTVPALQELAQLSGLAPFVAVVVLPILDAAEAPTLDALTLAWPRALPDDVQLLRSAIWPSCLPGFGVEPATTTERAEAAARHLPACEGCAIRASAAHPHGCAGVPAALDPGPGWRAWQKLPTTQAHNELANVDRACAEARGLALGLRRAWRLFVPQSDVPAYREAFAPLGWHVESAAAVEAGVGGTIRADGEGDRVLLLVAVTEEDAKTCLHDELANLQRMPAVHLVETRAHWQAIADAHRRLGAHYGYPPCCVEAFLDAHAEIVEQIRDTDNAIAVLRAALRTRQFDERLTSLPGLLGEEARTPLRHLPCRFDCPASQALAETLLADLAQHNPDWTARQRAYRPEPILLLADGTLVSLDAQAVAVDTVQEVRGMKVRLSHVASPELAARLAELQEIKDLQAIRVLPGVGLALQRGGVWQDWPLPLLEAPRAEEFPILLPFAPLDA
jgi:hypothetical protein